jgi:FkbM family methyltransferase
VNTGGVNTGRFVAGGIAVIILSTGIAVRLNPSSLILLSRDLKNRSPYCSPLKASLDGHIKLRQQARSEEIFRASRLIRSDRDLSLWSTPQGEFWIPQGDSRILPLLLAQEERDIYGKAEWGVHSGDVVLDVGAYIGTWTRQALARGAKTIIAIEPSPQSVECLRRNLARDVSDGHVIIYPKGIWDSEGALTLFGDSSTGVGNSFVEQNNSAQMMNAIPVTTIDKVAAELRLPRIDFIKADVKGATERLMRGGSEVLRRYRPRIAASTEEPVDNAGAIAALAQKIQPGYQMMCGPCLLDGHEIYTDVLFFR